MNWLIKDKAFYRTLAAIAIPIALQNMISFGVQLMDNVMLGSLGDTAISAASLGGQPFFILTVFGFGLSSGGTVLIAQYYGKGNLKAVRRVMGISMRFVALSSLLFTVVCSLFPEAILDIFSNEAEIIEAGAGYLKVVCLSYFFYSVSNCYMMSLRATENVNISTAVYGISFFVNVIFNYLFIFGKLGFPRLGIVGAAVGTLIARVSEFIMATLYMCFKEKRVRYNYSYVFRRENELLPDFFRHSLPVVGSELIWSLGAVTQTAIIGNISSTFVSANSIAGVIQQLAMVMMFGIGNASAVLMGKTIGEQNIDYAKKMGKTLLLISFGVGVTACCIIFAVRVPMLSLYRVSAETRALAFDILTVISLLNLGSATELTCITGILRGAGDTRYAFAVDAGCTWCIGVLMGYLAGFVWRLPVIWVFVCLRSDLPLRLVLCLSRIFRGNYIKNVTRDV